MGTPKGVFGKILIAAFSLFVALPSLRAQEKGDLDAYKWRVTAMWWYSHPSGTFNASSDQVSFDIDRDLHFSSYATFTGGVDWHFKRKHHFVFQASPVYSSRSSTLSRDITFRGVTYDLGATVAVDINSLSFAPRVLVGLYSQAARPSGARNLVQPFEYNGKDHRNRNRERNYSDSHLVGLRPCSLARDWTCWPVVSDPRFQPVFPRWRLPGHVLFWIRQLLLCPRKSAGQAFSQGGFHRRLSTGHQAQSSGDR